MSAIVTDDSYQRIQEAAYRLYEAGFWPYLIYRLETEQRTTDVFDRFNIYPRRSNGPMGGPRWPYITAPDTLHPPGASRKFPRAYIYASDFTEQEE